ncbi:C1q-related factor-like [Gadus morhua]|uniref:C1q-related factor-like n=1 Tax=Gadus morhua TaxID=8049 RepID=UPI0011B6A5A3|nr:C1q-related factor-like [Gadus morhua]
MELMFLLLVAFIFSSGQCLDTDFSTDPSSDFEHAELTDCQPDSCTVCREMSAMRERLAAMACTQDGLMKSVRSLRTAMAANQKELGVSSAQIPPLQGLTQELAQQLTALQESTSAAVPRQAFTAVLGHSLGPLPIHRAVKYPLIITNIGNGYNPATGSFTARVSGMYYFSYTMYSGSPTTNSVVGLMKNGQMIVTTWDTAGGDINDSATNAAVLQLEAGDFVYIQLYANRNIYDDNGRYNTFSGLMLYPL